MYKYLIGMVSIGPAPYFPIFWKSHHFGRRSCPDMSTNGNAISILAFSGTQVQDISRGLCLFVSCRMVQERGAVFWLQISRQANFEAKAKCWSRISVSFQSRWSQCQNWRWVSLIFSIGPGRALVVHRRSHDNGSTMVFRDGPPIIGPMVLNPP